MVIKERHHIILEKYPYYESTNKKIMEEISGFNFSRKTPYPTNIEALQYALENNEVTYNMRLVLDWIQRLIEMNNSVTKGAREYGGKSGCTMWFAKYNRGDYTLSHGHYPFALYGFVYFVNSPRGSSPLVFSTSGKRVKAEEGRVAIFPGNVYHRVPPNRCENRIILAGNIGYDLNGI